MVDLGKYAAEVLFAYGVSGALLVALVGLSMMRGRWVKRALAAAEERRKS